MSATVGTLPASSVTSAEARLSAAGCPTPAADAEALALESVAAAPERPLEHFEALLARRVRREPLAYLLGRQAFRGLELRVDARVYVPRPHTEALVEAGLALPHGARVIDLCTGSGTVALALAHERPDLRVSGADLSGEALTVARENGRRLGLEVSWLESDLLLGAPGPWDAVIANVPYIASAEEPALDPELTAYEPSAAFRAGADGLEVVRRLVAQASEVPWLALEIGDSQAPVVARMLSEAGFAQVAAHRDFTGVARVVVGRR